MASAELIHRQFTELFGRPPDAVASAPGRVNLIGEHTDYNEGFVLPVAIQDRAFAAIASRDDDRCVIHSAQYGASLAMQPRDCDGHGRGAWHDLARGVLCEFVAAGARGQAGIGGYDVLVDSDVAHGSGLSSSAAVEMALARALAEAEARAWVPLQMAALGQRVEHRYLGVRSGMMDQIIAASATDGMALLLDCRTFDARQVPLPDAATVMVMHTGISRTLDTSEYNARRGACEAALEALRKHDPSVRALRDVTPGLLAAAGHLLTEVQGRRVRHVVGENERVHAFATALESAEYERAGALLNASHSSLRDDYEVSSLHLDMICELARAHPACYGARLTGAGFGGCAIALVRTDAVDAFTAGVQPKYEAASYKQARFFTARPSGGARLHARTGTPEPPAPG